MSEEKDLVTIVREWYHKREASTPPMEKSYDEKMQGKIEEKPQTFEKPKEEKPEEKQKYPKLPNAKNPKHFRG